LYASVEICDLARSIEQIWQSTVNMRTLSKYKSRCMIQSYNLAVVDQRVLDLVARCFKVQLSSVLLHEFTKRVVRHWYIMRQGEFMKRVKAKLTSGSGHTPALRAEIAVKESSAKRD
jgi:hypothetical protein